MSTLQATRIVQYSLEFRSNPHVITNNVCHYIDDIRGRPVVTLGVVARIKRGFLVQNNRPRTFCRYFAIVVLLISGVVIKRTYCKAKNLGALKRAHDHHLIGWTGWKPSVCAQLDICVVSHEAQISDVE